MFRNITIATRVIFGFIFLALGLNGFFHFISLPTLSHRGMLFVQSMIHTGYLWPLIKFTEIGCGLLLVIGMFVPLSLVVLGPILVNILLFHFFLDAKGMPFAMILSVLYGFLLWVYRKSFRSLLSKETKEK